MIARFFIDRPIFAAVLSIVITLCGAIALLFLPMAQYPRVTPPAVAITIQYPGASAQVVADTVAAPLEQEINGVPGMLFMSGQMGNDGQYTLTVTFDVGTDVKTAVVMVQNRLALAMSQLPTDVQSQGIQIRKKTPDMLLIVNFFSRDRRYSDVYLSNYATINVRDELLRVPGVSDVNYMGQRDNSIRAWLDPQKMAALNVTAVDVATAIRNQNLDAPAGQIGQPPSAGGPMFQIPIETLGRLQDPEQFGEIIIKVRQSGMAPVTQAAVTPRRPRRGLAGTSGPATLFPAGGSLVNLLNSAMSPSTRPADPGLATTPLYVPSLAIPASIAPPGTTPGTPEATTTPQPTTDAGGALPGLSISGGANGMDNGFGGAATDATPGQPSLGIVRLRDVARVHRGAQNYNQACTFDGQPSVGLSVYQLPGTNALEAAAAVRKKMEELKTRFPEGVEYAIGYDTTPYVRESVQDVLTTLLEAVALVGIVVLVFLQDWRAMILPMIDVPVSIIGTCAVMAAVGFSLNNISLFGLVLAIGIVVDDAIVVLENIERLLGQGMEVRAATIKAMDEVTGPIIAVALVLCAVFVPCAFVPGITGQFFRQFAVTISVSTVISAINAITMTPSRAVILFKDHDASKKKHHHREALPWWSFGVAGGIVTILLAPRFFQATGYSLPFENNPDAFLTPQMAVSFVPGALVGGLLGWFIIRPVNAALGWSFRTFNRGFDGMTDGYGWLVGKALPRKRLVLVVYGGLLVLTYWVFHRAPTGFIPQQDQGRLIVSVQLPDSASLQRTQAAVAKIEKIALETPGVKHVVAFSGNSFILQATSPNFASMFVVLDSFDKRQRPDLRDTAIMAKLRRAWVAEVKEAKVSVYGSSPIPGLGTAGGFKFIIEDRGDLGPVALQEQTDEVVRKLKSVPGLNNVATQFRSKTPQLFLDVDRTKAATLGVNLNDVNQTLDIFLGSLYVNSYNDFGRHWQVTLQADGAYRTRVENINLFQVRNKWGQMVSLGTLVKPREIGGPLSLTRYNLYSSSSIVGNIQTGYSSGEAIQQIEEIAAQTLPLSMKPDWTDLMLLQIRAGNTAIYVFLLGIVAAFLALAALYESWSLPLAVILVVPLCLLCSVSVVLLTKRDVNIFVQIGLVVLVGLACKNAILIVEYARQLHQEGHSIFMATKEASRLRLRPILMTSLAFILGVVPLMVANGAGQEMRRSLGTAVFSGMLGVTLFGIFLTPVFFYVIQSLDTVRMFGTGAVRRAASYGVGTLVGLGSGYMFGQVSTVPVVWATVVGGLAGAVGVAAVLGVHEAVRPGPAATDPGEPTGDKQ